jgi:hypothetical protein
MFAMGSNPARRSRRKVIVPRRDIRLIGRLLLVRPRMAVVQQENGPTQLTTRHATTTIKPNLNNQI